jgi:hypothetical protein
LPRLDGTGPNGMGPITGRGLGRCSTFFRPVFLRNRLSGRGMSRYRYWSRSLWLVPGLVLGIFYWTTNHLKKGR